MSYPFSVGASAFVELGDGGAHDPQIKFTSDDGSCKWNGFPVVNGDESDLRFLDGSGVVVGLYAKGTARHDDSGFVVDTSSARVSLPVI